ncbi:hypothetical protein QA601_17815 [Chitinispirillales bacterium ANBcel5]|uniref:hypothetical protein n=1 Tax=Cellulosispirillum alkaliphilum TaxID=3039283 RepID=UPI002A4FD933|nr:hypothetical protein [Chitinispirillales bacterium ANBcel5]
MAKDGTVGFLDGAEFFTDALCETASWAAIIFHKLSGLVIAPDATKVLIDGTRASLEAGEWSDARRSFLRGGVSVLLSGYNRRTIGDAGRFGRNISAGVDNAEMEIFDYLWGLERTNKYRYWCNWYGFIYNCSTFFLEPRR